MAEVDAAGRYIDRSRRCAEGLDVPSRTLERGALYTNGVGVKSVCLFMRASQGLTARTSRGQIPRFSFYVAEDKEDRTRPVWGICGHKRNIKCCSIPLHSCCSSQRCA